MSSPHRRWSGAARDGSLPCWRPTPTTHGTASPICARSSRSTWRLRRGTAKPDGGAFGQTPSPQNPDALRLACRRPGPAHQPRQRGVRADTLRQIVGTQPGLTIVPLSLGLRPRVGSRERTSKTFPKTHGRKIKIAESFRHQPTVQSPMAAYCHTGNLAFVPLVLKLLERHLNCILYDQ